MNAHSGSATTGQRVSRLAVLLGKLEESVTEIEEILREGLEARFGRTLEPVRVSEYGGVGGLEISDDRLEGLRRSTDAHALVLLPCHFPRCLRYPPARGRHKYRCGRQMSSWNTVRESAQNHERTH